MSMPASVIIYPSRPRSNKSRMKSLNTRIQLHNYPRPNRRDLFLIQDLTLKLSTKRVKFLNQTQHGRSFQIASPTKRHNPIPKIQTFPQVPMSKFQQLNAVKNLKTYIKEMQYKEWKYFQKLKFALRHLKCLNLSMAGIWKIKEIIGTQPFSRPQSLKFIKACKNGDDRIVRKMVFKDPLLVHVFDNLNLTGLHWAAKRDNLEVMDILLRTGAFVDNLDLVINIQFHRTPLYLACRFGSVTSVSFLLLKGADPWVHTKSGQYPLHVSKLAKVSRQIEKEMIKKFTNKFEKIPKFLKIQRTKSKIL